MRKQTEEKEARESLAGAERRTTEAINAKKEVETEKELGNTKAWTLTQ